MTVAGWVPTKKQLKARRVRDAAYRKANRAVINARQRVSQRRRRRGVTPEMVADAMEKQKGLCALCMQPLIAGVNPDADHDHVTGQFRGMVHRLCNVGLGAFNDDIRLLEMAVSYL